MRRADRLGKAAKQPKEARTPLHSCVMVGLHDLQGSVVRPLNDVSGVGDRGTRDAMFMQEVDYHQQFDRVCHHARQLSQGQAGERHQTDVSSGRIMERPRTWRFFSFESLMAAMAEHPAASAGPSSPSLPSSLRVAVLMSPADLRHRDAVVGRDVGSCRSHRYATRQVRMHSQNPDRGYLSKLIQPASVLASQSSICVQWLRPKTEPRLLRPTESTGSYRRRLVN